MKFLYPSGGIYDARFAGIVTGPQHRGIPYALRRGALWLGDMGCLAGPPYVKRFNARRAGAWLESVAPYVGQCLAVTVPDVVGDARATIAAWEDWAGRFVGFPLAFVAQNGLTAIPDLVPEPSVFFVGGDTEWKCGAVAERLIQDALERGWHIHIGRVNWWRRYEHFRVMPGSAEFTCDGTRTRYDGRVRTLEAWHGYQAQGVFDFSVFGGDCAGESGGDVVGSAGRGR